MVELLTALFLTLARLCLSTGVVLLTLASFAWWGNPQSPLGGLLGWGIGGLAAGAAFLGAHRIVLSRLRRRCRPAPVETPEG